MNIRHFLFSTVLAITLLFTLNYLERSTTHAQATHSPTVQIVDVDTGAFPQLNVTIGGSNWPTTLDIPSITITLDGNPLPLQSDQIAQQGLQLALAVDINELVTRNEAGQSRFVQLTGTLLDLVDDNVLVRNQDWLAAYHLHGDGEPQLLQPWTQEPNLLFNSIVSNRPVEIRDAPLAAQSLLQLIEEMSTEMIDGAESVSLPKVILLFTSGAALQDADVVIDAAQQAAVTIHVVELLGGATTTPSETLQTLATESGGHYTALTTPQQSTEVVNALTNAHAVRILQTRVDTPTPQSLTVAVTLPDNTILEATTDTPFADLTIAPLTIALAEPQETIDWDQLADSTTGDASTRLLPIRTNISWPDGQPRNLSQLSYTLRGPGGFAQQEIRTEAPFNEAVLPLANLEEGTYTLEIRALDELGLATEFTNSSLRFRNLPLLTQATTGTGNSSDGNQPVAQPLSEQAAALSANDTESGSAAVQRSGAGTEPDNTVQLPGFPISIPRALLVWLLPILLILIGYLIFSDRRERRKPDVAAAALDAQFAAETHDNEFYDLQQDQAQGRIKDRYTLDGTKEPATERYALRKEQAAVGAYARQAAGEQEDPNPLPAPVVAGGQPQQAIPISTAQGAASGWHDSQESDEFDDEDEATDRPPQPDDEEATYRTEDVARSIVGYLVRTTSDPNLPKELPIYGLNPTTSEMRQIYIGRHSQNNTLVINDRRVSREHAVIIQREGRLYLRDNASTAGTFLNWKQLTPGEELLLRHNDLIGFGQIAYEFRLHSEDEATVLNG